MAEGGPESRPFGANEAEWKSQAESRLDGGAEFFNPESERPSAVARGAQELLDCQPHFGVGAIGIIAKAEALRSRAGRAVRQSFHVAEMEIPESSSEGAVLIINKERVVLRIAHLAIELIHDRLGQGLRGYLKAHVLHAVLFHLLSIGAIVLTRSMNMKHGFVTIGF
jgi:hypothetical protein